MYPKYRDATIQMLKNIRIKDPESVYYQYILSPELIAEFDQTNLIPLDKDQTGGGNTEIHYKFDNRDFVIYEAKASGGGYDFSIHKNDDVDDSSCLHVITHPKNNIAVIINILNAITISILNFGINVNSQFTIASAIIIKRHVIILITFFISLVF